MKRYIAVILSLIFLISFLGGCSSKSKDKDIHVRIAFFPNITHSQALLGKADGSFQKALGKNKIEWKQFNAGPAEVEALFAGEVDIGYIGPGPAINANVKSKGDVQIIAGSADAGAILVSRSGLVIKDLKELSGKRIAVPQFGNTQDLCLRNILQENGLKDTTKGGTVEIRQVENPDVKTLFEKGELDAAMVPEPWGSVLVNDVNANVVLDYNKVWKEGRYPTAVVAVRKEFLESHPDIVEKFLKAHVELTEYIKNNLEKSKEMINNQIEELTKKPLSKKVLNDSFNRLIITYNPETGAIMDFAKMSQSTGMLKEIPKKDNLIDLGILNKALKDKGLERIK